MNGGDASEEEITCCKGMCSFRSSCLMLAIFALILSHSVFDDNGTEGDAKKATEVFLSKDRKYFVYLVLRMLFCKI